MTSEQLQNAQLIISIGQSLGANEQQLLAALEAALVESGLRNLNYGDRDSVGLFQQRTSQGWGSIAQILDPSYSAQAFFLGAGSNNGVFAVSQSGTAGQMAQRVQRSAYPGRYDQHESEAHALLAQFAGPIVVPNDAYSSYDPPANAGGSDFFQTSTIGTAGAIGIGVAALVLLFVISDW